ncbi:MAG TPA: NAD(P)/FAD-dependent oxidoreductase [Pyrinomonadaceae bacterium]|jgi:NADH dehydrogenase
MRAGDGAGREPRVVIVGGGFGGLYAAKALANKPVHVVLVDRKNHHTFQPLLYQVATSVLSPGEIAEPLRRILHRARNVEVIMGEVTGFDTAARRVQLRDGSALAYDYLIVAAGARHSYFGHDDWERDAPGLKTIEDSVEIRRRLLLAFELAEREAYLTGRHEPLTFAVIGGGPTGVELAGAIADIARRALAQDYKAIDTTKARVVLFEGASRVLGMFPEALSRKAEKQLRELGVEVRTDSLVTGVEARRIRVGDEWLPVSAVLWATGVAASPLGKALGAEVDRAGRVLVAPDLSVPGHKDIFVIGDMASLTDVDGVPVPGLGAAATQEGQLTAANIQRDLRGEARVPFRYRDKGSMATIGRNRAVALIGRRQLSGYVAWLMWAFVHVFLLIGFRNRLAVMREWVWAYFTRERSARLITGDTDAPGWRPQLTQPAAATEPTPAPQPARQ